MKSILFVDDDRNVLSGLRDLLRARRKEWEMIFVSSGDEALGLLEQRAFDVVVSDMRMPAIDGAMLLQRTKERHPRTVRIILSGQTDLDVAMKTVSIAHQFLAKPCDADQLQQVVRRACDLGRTIDDDEVRGLVGGIARLPSTPGSYLELNALLASGNPALPDIARVIEKDVAMCAKLLQLVNSAFFGLPRRTTSALEAATCLGTSMLRKLAGPMGVFAAFDSAAAPGAAIVDALQRHSILAAHVARSMFKDKRRSEDAFMAGMLHEIGGLIRLAYPITDAGVAVRPALLGAYLIGLWGIPYPVVEAVAHHDDPAALAHAELDLSDAVHIAHHLAAEQIPLPRFGGGLTHDSPERALDTTHLERLGVTANDLAALRQTTLEEVHGRPAA